MFTAMADPVRDLTFDDKWNAVRRRSTDLDGAFVFAVKTTGVYCRPSCASRPAKRENVSFFATPEAAERAGFRACKRCRPDRAAEPDRHVALVRRACATIAAAEEPPSVAALAAEASLSPFHFHRVFKAVTGVTPKAYAAETRARRAAEALRTASTVTEAIYDAGLQRFEPFLRNGDGSARHDADRRPGGEGRAPSSALRSARPRSAPCWSPPPTRASRRSCSATTRRRWCASFRTSFPRAKLVGGDAAFERTVRSGRRPRRGARPTVRLAARHPRHRLPAAGLAGFARDPGRRDGDLWRDRQGDRPSQGRARRRPGLRRQSARGGDPVPPRRADRRRPFGLPVGRRAQARAHRARGGAMTTAALEAAAVDRFDWGRIERDLDAYGAAVAPKLLTPEACRAIAALYPDDARFRSTVVMARHGFGRGEYKYFAEPLPDAGRRAAPRPLSAARPDRQPLERGDGRPDPVSGRAQGLPSASVAPPARRGRRRSCCATGRRLQLPASGRLRRALVSAAGGDPALGARAGFFRRRVRADRAAAAHAVARRGREPRAGRRRDLRRARRPGQARAGRTGRRSATASAASRAASASPSAIIFHDAA